jgi:predicted neuraminidase
MKLKPLLLAICIALIPSLLHAAPEPCEVRREFIYDSAPFPSCHASTLVETRTGLVAAWFGGTHEKHPDVGIWVSRLVKGKWTAPVEVADGVHSPTLRFPTWNPVLHQIDKGPLLLFYKVGPNPDRWWGMVKSSTDGGKTWSDARQLPHGILGPIKNRAETLSDGTIVSGCSSEEGGWRTHFERSSDNGLTWERTPDLGDPKTMGLIQPGLARLPGDRLLAFCRSRVGKVFLTESSDGGRHWSEPEPTVLPNPNSGLDAIGLRDGRVLMIYNHAGGNWGARSPLNVAVSPDGREWREVAVLEDDPGKEFSYPAVIQTSDGLVHFTYTWHRKKIRHVVVDPARFQPRALPPTPTPAPRR